MFFNKQSTQQKKEYEDFLKTVGSFSNIFSESDIPYLYYRIAEKIFCKSFNAQDLSRSDVSADAKKDNIWIWLKTFLANNNKTLQKVAEFNKDRYLYSDLDVDALINKVSQLRNARIDFTEKVYNLDSSIYHCVLREKNKFKIFEESMERIDISKICNVKKNKNTIVFHDKIHEYSFSLSKSTLSKRFITQNVLHQFSINIIEDPLSELRKIVNSESTYFQENFQIKGTIFLPLYWKNFEVSEKSWLNLWNAKWRKRNPNEVYVSVPAIIHKRFPWFFPERDVAFDLKFPDGEIVSSKICQDGWKAFMTNPNKKLGQLILRDWLKLKEWELATYEKLQNLGIDSIRIDKMVDNTFEINFSINNSYEEFISNTV